MRWSLYGLSTASPIAYTAQMTLFSLTPTHILLAIVAIAVLVFAILFIIARRHANRLIHSSHDKRQQRYANYPELHPTVIKQQHQLAAYPLCLTTSDGLHLSALYAPSRNGAVVILSHGYKMDCAEMIPIATLLVSHGYGILLPNQRSHGCSDGEQISFGNHEWRDLEAAVNFLVHQENASSIGLFGNSMGGALALCYAARDPRIAAVIAQSPYASIAHSINKGVRQFSGLAPFPFAPLIHYHAQRKLNINTASIAPLNTIAAISPRPILLMMGGQDHHVEPDGIFKLHQAAGDTAELWYEPDLDHVEFYQKLPLEFEQRVVDFYNRHLLNQEAVGANNLIIHSNPW